LLSSIRAALAALASDVAVSQPDKARGVIEIAEDKCERLIQLISDLQDGHSDS
jgi:signal transduction histidine kinase